MDILKSLLIPILISSAGCSSHHQPKVGEFARHGQAPSLDLSHYADVQTRKGPQDPQLVVAAAISGGGHRAANFGAGALAELENIVLKDGRSNVLMEIDYFSTVSGGGFAAGSFLVTLFDHISGGRHKGFEDFDYGAYLNGDYSKQIGISETNEFCRDCEPYDQPMCVLRNIERGYGEAVYSSVIRPNIWFSDKDRGDYLEKKIDSKLLGSCWRGAEDESALVLADVMPRPNSTPSLPFWVTNSTVFQNGSIFPFSPDILDRYGVDVVHHRVGDLCIDSEDPDCLKSHFDVPVSVGVKASASFPAVVPATTMHSSYYENEDDLFVHLVDGGVSDNLGVHTATSLLEQDGGSSGSSGKRQKVLIVIDAFKSNQEPFSTASGSPTIALVAWNLVQETPLSSWRGRHMKYLADLVDRDDNVSLIYLNFETLVYGTKIASALDCDKIDRETLSQLAKNVATDFDLDIKEQQALMCAGKQAVRTLETCINQIFVEGQSRICGGPQLI